MLFTESKLIFVTTKKKGQLFQEASKYLASDAGFAIHSAFGKSERQQLA